MGDLGIYRGERRRIKMAREGKMHRVRNELRESQRKPERTAR